MYERLGAKILRGVREQVNSPLKNQSCPQFYGIIMPSLYNFNSIVLTVVFSLKPSIHMDYETNKKINGLQFTIKWPFINILLIIIS